MTCDDMEGRTRALAAWLDSSTHEPWAFSSAQAAAALRALLLDYQERGRALEAIQIEAEREDGRWVHLKRVIAINARAALTGEDA